MFIELLTAGDIERALQAVPAEFERATIAQIETRLHVDHSEALSLYHRAILKLHELNGHFEYRNPDALRSYLVITAKGLYKKEQRMSEAFTEGVTELASRASEDLSTDIEAPDYSINWQIVNKCLLKVPCKCQLLLVLKKHAGWTHGRISYELGETYKIGSEVSARNQFHCCKRRLRRLVAEEIQSNGR